MNATQPIPPRGIGPHSMTTQAFQEAFRKGLFQPADVYAFWGNDTHFDPNLSVWIHPQPPDATRVVLYPVPPESAIIPPSSAV